MASKAPIAREPTQGEPPEESLLGRSDVSKASAKNQLLGRIASALQVPSSALYAPPNAVAPAIQPEVHSAIEDECLKLLRAYNRIQDPMKRRRVLALVQEAAERV